MKKILETFHVGSFVFLDWENDNLSTSKQSKSKSSIMSDPCFSLHLSAQSPSKLLHLKEKLRFLGYNFGNPEKPSFCINNLRNKHTLLKICDYYLC